MLVDPWCQGIKVEVEVKLRSLTKAVHCHSGRQGTNIHLQLPPPPNNLAKYIFPTIGYNYIIHSSLRLLHNGVKACATVFAATSIHSRSPSSTMLINNLRDLHLSG
jgi:hypothetical protein